MLINTGRGALIETVAVIEALKKGKIGYLGLDVMKRKPVCSSKTSRTGSCAMMCSHGSSRSPTC